MRAVVVRLWSCIPVHVRHDPAQIYWDCTIDITILFVSSLLVKASHVQVPYAKYFTIRIALG
jgi:hypothetical protein